MKAEKDLAAGRWGLTGSDDLLEDAVFHAQQAAEKALKAFLASREQPFAKTHELLYLARQCEQLDAEFAALEPAVCILNPYLSQFRYPGGDATPDRRQAEEALELAAGIVAFVRARL